MRVAWAKTELVDRKIGSTDPLLLFAAVANQDRKIASRGFVDECSTRMTDAMASPLNSAAARSPSQFLSFVLGQRLLGGRAAGRHHQDLVEGAHFGVFRPRGAKTVVVFEVISCLKYRSTRYNRYAILILVLVRTTAVETNSTHICWAYCCCRKFEFVLLGCWP